MSDFNISIPGGTSKRLKTGGKYCPADIVVTAEGSGGSTSSEMTDIGADIYIVLEGQCLTFTELAVMDSGGSTTDYAIALPDFKVFVRDELPLVNYTGIEADDLPLFLCVTHSDGRIYNGEHGNWTLLSDQFGGIPEHGWIDKSVLDTLDYTDPNNMGLYAVRTVRYPMLDGTLIDLASDLDVTPSNFDRHQLLNTVNLPNAKAIGKFAFYMCFSLTSINIPSAVAIGESAFECCKALNNVIIPNSIRIINNRAFCDCESLTNITFVGTVEQWNTIQLGMNWRMKI